MNGGKKICMHHFSSSKKSLSCCSSRHGNQGSCSKNCPFASECPTPELDQGVFWSSCLPQLPAVYFGDREGPWATLSSRCYCLPRWARTPYLSLLLLSASITFPLHRSLTSLCLCSTGTCGPTEALGYTKKPKLAFICSLLPAVYIVHLCSLSVQKKYRFYPWHCYYYWLWVIALPAEMLASRITPCDVLLKFWHVFVSALCPKIWGFWKQVWNAKMFQNLSIRYANKAPFCKSDIVIIIYHF